MAAISIQSSSATPTAFKKASEVKLSPTPSEQQGWTTFFVRVPPALQRKQERLIPLIIDKIRTTNSCKAVKELTKKPPDHWVRIRKRVGLPMTLKVDDRIKKDMLNTEEPKLHLQYQGRVETIHLLPPFSSAFRFYWPEDTTSSTEVQGLMQGALHEIGLHADRITFEGVSGHGILYFSGVLPDWHATLHPRQPCAEFPLGGNAEGLSVTVTPTNKTFDMYKKAHANAPPQHNWLNGSTCAPFRCAGCCCAVLPDASGPKKQTQPKVVHAPTATKQKQPKSQAADQNPPPETSPPHRTRSVTRNYAKAAAKAQLPRGQAVATAATSNLVTERSPTDIQRAQVDNSQSHSFVRDKPADHSTHTGGSGRTTSPPLKGIATDRPPDSVGQTNGR